MNNNISTVAAGGDGKVEQKHLYEGLIINVIKGGSSIPALVTHWNKVEVKHVHLLDRLKGEEMYSGEQVDMFLRGVEFSSHAAVRGIIHKAEEGLEKQKRELEEHIANKRMELNEEERAQSVLREHVRTLLSHFY